MAADTESADTRKFKEIVLLEGELVIRIYPGLEAGIMKIMVKGNVRK